MRRLESAAGGRARLLLALWIALALLGLVLRCALAAHEGLLERPLALARVLALGSLTDALATVVLLAPLALALALGSGGLVRRPRVRFTLLAALLAVAAFGAFVEYFFFEEFEARFNHIALDYLLYPDEVAGNVWQSYPVPLFALLALATGAGAAALAQRGLRGAAFQPAAWRSRALGAGGALAAAALAVLALRVLPDLDSGDRRVDEVAANGAVQLVRAFRSASLPYDSYYRTLPQDEMWRRARSELGWPDPATPARELRAARRRAEPLDVVVVLGESFGSEFVGRLGGSKPCAPGLERWADEGLLLTNLMATGNRTVRGLEGVLCSFVPLPGDSIWKRDKSEDVATLAGVLAQRGYRTEFVYGGAGTFDGMRAFALENGWQRFVEDGLVGASSYPDGAFRTAWGVADEHIFDALLERQRQAARDGVRFFGTALTVSNHKPFLTPDTRARGVRRDEVLSSAGWGAGLLAATTLLWRRWARRGRRRMLAIALGAVWLGFLAQAWTGAQPHASRESAVRYADRALAGYLDRARSEGLLDHTVVLFVGDHGARVYGAEEIPAASYRVPALFVAPDPDLRGRTIGRLCSQIDLAPTLLSIAGVDCRAPFFGQDLLALPPDGPGRAWLIHNRDVGLLTDTTLTVLGLRGTTTFYRRPGRASDAFERVARAAAEPGLLETADRAAAVFQVAAQLYEGRRYGLGDVR